MIRNILTAAFIVSASVAHAGGPVIVTEEAPIADVRPQGDGGKWVVPVIIGAVILCAIACGGDGGHGDEVPPTTDGGC
jgi:hypothetical protein